jgi:protein subunit release factor B
MSQVKERKLLFSITKEDFNIDWYSAPGAGGQNKNKTKSACRITHKESGAIGNASEERSSLQNKKKALERLVETKKFKAWHKLKTSFALQGIQDIEKELNKRVDKMLEEQNLKIEYIGEQQNN